MKVYRDTARGLRVPMRQIELTPPHAAVLLYDTRPVTVPTQS